MNRTLIKSSTCNEWLCPFPGEFEDGMSVLSWGTLSVLYLKQRISNKSCRFLSELLNILLFILQIIFVSFKIIFIKKLERKTLE
jgi:hypothetical protein